MTSCSKPAAAGPRLQAHTAEAHPRKHGRQTGPATNQYPLHACQTTASQLVEWHQRNAHKKKMVTAAASDHFCRRKACSACAALWLCWPATGRTGLCSTMAKLLLEFASSPDEVHDAGLPVAGTVSLVISKAKGMRCSRISVQLQCRELSQARSSGSRSGQLGRMGASVMFRGISAALKRAFPPCADTHSEAVTHFLYLC